MKRLIFILIGLLISCIVFAQSLNLAEVEYYIDTDPGYGTGTSVSTSSLSELDLDFLADVSELDEGMHVLYVRAKDENGNWSMTLSHTFYIGFNIPKQNITLVEYYFDNDPGYGNANAISFTPATDVDIVANFGVDELADGIHEFFIRAQDSEGQWTYIRNHNFYKGIFSCGEAANIQDVEYYINSDPGFGNGTKVSFQKGTELDLTFDIDLTGLEGTTNELFIRAQDENGSWSLIHKHEFYVTVTDVFNIDDSGCFRVFPNPSNGEFSVEFDGNTSDVLIEILNTNGQVIYKKEYSTNYVDDKLILNSAAGLYFIKVTSGQESFIKKLRLN